MEKELISLYNEAVLRKGTTGYYHKLFSIQRKMSGNTFTFEEDYITKEDWNFLSNELSFNADDLAKGILSLINVSMPSEKIELVKDQRKYSEKSDVGFDEANKYCDTRYLLRFPDRKLSYLMFSVPTSCFAWLLADDYLNEHSEIDEPLVSRSYLNRNNQISLQLLEGNFFNFGFGDVFPIVQDFVDNLNEYLVIMNENKPYVGSMNSNVLNYYIDKTKEKEHDKNLFPFESLPVEIANKRQAIPFIKSKKPMKEAL